MNVVLCNCPPDRALPLARALVEQGLAACVNVLPAVTSVYQWKGRVEQESEHTLLIKVSAARVEALAERIRALHPYDVPEIVVLPVDVALSDPRYVAWVRQT